MTSHSRGTGALVGGSLLVASLSSACCWLPLLAVTLGFSAVGVGTLFEGYRVVLLALAGGFLVGAVVLRRRRRRVCEGDECPAPNRARRALPLLGGLGVLAFAVVPEVIGWTRTDKPAATSATPNELVATYTVTGMTCEGCTSLLVGYLEQQPEITTATVDYATDTARVEFVPGTPEPDAVMRRVANEWETYTFERFPARGAR